MTVHPAACCQCCSCSRLRLRRSLAAATRPAPTRSRAPAAVAARRQQLGRDRRTSSTPTTQATRRRHRERGRVDDHPAPPTTSAATDQHRRAMRSQARHGPPRAEPVALPRAPPDAVALAPGHPRVCGAPAPRSRSATWRARPTTSCRSSLAPGTFDRKFLVIAPDDLAPDERLPVMFMWHWLGGEARTSTSAPRPRTPSTRSASSPSSPRAATGHRVFQWPFTASSTRRVARGRVPVLRRHAVVRERAVQRRQGLRQQRRRQRRARCSPASSPAAAATAWHPSCRCRAAPAATWSRLDQAPEHKLPGMVLWGGPDDFCIVIDFEETSKDLEMHLSRAATSCSSASTTATTRPRRSRSRRAMTAFAPLWEFLRDHPYWLEPGESPYITEGLPLSMPTWCAVGAGNAIPPPGVCDRNRTSAPEGEGIWRD